MDSKRVYHIRGSGSCQPPTCTSTVCLAQMDALGIEAETLSQPAA
jgi:hypothetical protein